MHLCTLVFTYSYISLSIHIPLYHLCIISFMHFYHDLAIHILSIFLSYMLLLIHVFLSCSIYSFMYDNHIFIPYTLIFISCHLLVTSYILLTYIFLYFIRISYLKTYTYTFLYLYVSLVLYQTVLSPVGVQNRDSSFDTCRYFSLSILLYISNLHILLFIVHNDNNIFISYTLIFTSYHILVTSYILLTYIFMYFIRLSYLMTYTYTFLYLYVFLVLYHTVLSPVGV